MRKALYIFTLFLLFTSCKKTPTIDPSSDTTPQTTLMYMTGTDLSYYFNQNITAIKTAVAQNSLGKGRFILFKHSSSTSGSLIEYRYENGSCVADTLKTYSGITSLSQDAIVEVIGDAKELAEADSYNLIVSGHATSWVLKDYYSSWSKASRMSAATQSEEDEIDWDAMSTSPVVTRYLGSSSDGLFDIEEFRASLEATQTHFGFILFDECFMSSIETGYELRNLCDYIVASPCEIMGAGFPYDTVIPYLYSSNGHDFDLKNVCKAYYDYYASYSFPSGCVAMTVTSELEALANLTLQINSRYTGENVDLDSIQAYERLNGHLFFDFEQYMLAKCEDNTLAAQFEAQMEAAFPSECRLTTERFFANIGISASSANDYEAYYTTLEYYSGVTTSAPSTRMTSAWQTTSWAEATN